MCNQKAVNYAVIGYSSSRVAMIYNSVNVILSWNSLGYNIANKRIFLFLFFSATCKFQAMYVYLYRVDECFFREFTSCLSIHEILLKTTVNSCKSYRVLSTSPASLLLNISVTVHFLFNRFS